MGVISAHIPLERHFPSQTKIPEKPGVKPLFGDFTLELLIRFERTTCSLRERQHLRFYNVSKLKQKPLAPPLAPPHSPSRWRSFCIFAGRFPPCRTKVGARAPWRGAVRRHLWHRQRGHKGCAGYGLHPGSARRKDGGSDRCRAVQPK